LVAGFSDTLYSNVMVTAFCSQLNTLHKLLHHTDTRVCDIKLFLVLMCTFTLRRTTNRLDFTVLTKYQHNTIVIFHLSMNCKYLNSCKRFRTHVFGNFYSTANFLSDPQVMSSCLRTFWKAERKKCSWKLEMIIIIIIIIIMRNLNKQFLSSFTFLCSFSPLKPKLV
jgi:hypothetical protein